jgi:uncharacterized membrane protein
MRIYKMADAQKKREFNKGYFYRLYSLSLSYAMILVLSTGLFIGLFLAYLFFKPIPLYLYVAVASIIILIPSLIGFIRTYMLAKEEVKRMNKNGGRND